MDDLQVTIGVIISTLGISALLRLIVLPALIPSGRILNLVLEAIATFELCAVAFEQGLLLEYQNGLLLFSGVLITICMWRSYFWVNVSTSPNVQIEMWNARQLSLFAALQFILVEIIAGSLVFQFYTKLVWSMELSGHHIEKLHTSGDTCQTQVQVHYLLGTLIEAVGTFACVILLRLVDSVQRIPEQLGTLIKACIITGIVVIALPFTGGYMSPVLASVLQFGCIGITPFQHFVVYWISATIGSLASYYTWHAIRDWFISTTGINDNDGDGSDDDEPRKSK